MKEILAPGVPVKRQTEDDSKVRSAPGRGSPPKIAGSVADHACSWVGAVAAIEGGLVASRVLQNQGPFLRTMAALSERLTGR